MKKLLSVILSILLIFSLSGCSSSTSDTEVVDQGSADVQESDNVSEITDDTEMAEDAFDTSTDDQSDKTDEAFDQDNLYQYGTVVNADGVQVSFGDTLRSVTQKLGSPDIYETDDDLYEWSDADNYMYVWLNDAGDGGLFVKITEENTIWEIIVLNSDDWHFPSGIGYGSTESDAISEMGAPNDSVTGDYLYYYFDTDFSEFSNGYVGIVSGLESISEEGGPSIVIFQDEFVDAETEKTTIFDMQEDTEEASEETEEEGYSSYAVTYQGYTLYEDYSGDVRDYIIIEVENTGTTDLYLDSASFSFEDADGNLLGVESGLISSDPEIIAPGEKGYFYQNMGSPTGNLDVDEEYTLVADLTIKVAANKIVRYEISDTSISEGSTGPVDVIGRITNSTDEDDSLVWIAVILYDENDIPLGVCGTNITDLSAGQTQTFSLSSVYLSHLDISLEDVDHYQLYACKTQYQW